MCWVLFSDIWENPANCCSTYTCYACVHEHSSWTAHQTPHGVDLQHSSNPCSKIPKSRCVFDCAGEDKRVRLSIVCVSSNLKAAKAAATEANGIRKERRRRPSWAALHEKSLCVYTHDGSRPHCDVLFMPYQFIMTRLVPGVKPSMHTHTHTHMHGHAVTRQSSLQLFSVCTFASVNI